jgi:methylmalonyl-CoA/ethylmalonyl-CoA epimerase
MFQETPKIHHVGVVVPDMEASENYMQIFGHSEDYRGYVAPFQCWCIFLKAPPGQPSVELIVPDGGPLARFNKGSGGIHHYAYETPDIAKLQRDLAARDIAMVESAAVKGAGNFLCNFINPIATRGVIVEFVQLL